MGDNVCQVIAVREAADPGPLGVVPGHPPPRAAVKTVAYGLIWALMSGRSSSSSAAMMKMTLLEVHASVWCLHRLRSNQLFANESEWPRSSWRRCCISLVARRSSTSVCLALLSAVHARQHPAGVGGWGRLMLPLIGSASQSVTLGLQWVRERRRPAALLSIYHIWQRSDCSGLHVRCLSFIGVSGCDVDTHLPALC